MPPINLRAKCLLPVHWGKFSLANHPWNKPVTLAVKKVAGLNIPITTPVMGETVIINNAYPSNVWWNILCKTEDRRVNGGLTRKEVAGGFF